MVKLYVGITKFFIQINKLKTKIMRKKLLA